MLAAVAALAVAGSAARSEDSRVAMAPRPSTAALADWLDRGAAAPPVSDPASAPTPASDSVRRAIEDANAKWLAAFRSGDAAALARRYTEDASIVPPGHGTVAGREQIAAFFRAQRDAGLSDLQLRTLDVVVVGDLAYETGAWDSRTSAVPASEVVRPPDSGRYYAIWKAQPDGNWICQVGIWNNDRDLARRP